MFLCHSVILRFSLFHCSVLSPFISLGLFNNKLAISVDCVKVLTYRFTAFLLSSCRRSKKKQRKNDSGEPHKKTIRTSLCISTFLFISLSLHLYFYVFQATFSFSVSLSLCLCPTLFFQSFVVYSKLILF